MLLARLFLWVLVSSLNEKKNVPCTKAQETENTCLLFFWRNIVHSLLGSQGNAYVYANENVSA